MGESQFNPSWIQAVTSRGGWILSEGTVSTRQAWLFCILHIWFYCCAAEPWSLHVPPGQWACRRRHHNRRTSKVGVSTFWIHNLTPTYVTFRCWGQAIISLAFRKVVYPLSSSDISTTPVPRTASLRLWAWREVLRSSSAPAVISREERR